MAEEKVLMKYVCDYCRHEFSRKVGRCYGNSNMEAKKHKSVSSQVVCPSCGNFIRTWE